MKALWDHGASLQLPALGAPNPAIPGATVESGLTFPLTPTCFPGALSCPGEPPPRPHLSPLLYVLHTYLPMPFTDITSGAKGERRSCKQLLFPSVVQESSTPHAPDITAPSFHTPLTELLDPCPGQRIPLEEWGMLKSTPVF